MSSTASSSPAVPQWITQLTTLVPACTITGLAAALAFCALWCFLYSLLVDGVRFSPTFLAYFPSTCVVSANAQYWLAATLHAVMSTAAFICIALFSTPVWNCLVPSDTEADVTLLVTLAPIIAAAVISLFQFVFTTAPPATLSIALTPELPSGVTATPIAPIAPVAPVAAPPAGFDVASNVVADVSNVTTSNPLAGIEQPVAASSSSGTIGNAGKV